MKSRLFLILILFFLASFTSNILFAQNAPVTTAGSSLVCSNNNVIVPINLSGFTQITAISLRIDFNPTLLNYTGSVNINANLPGGVIVNKVVVSSTLHKIMIIWSDLNPVTLGAGSKLLDLKFTYLSGNPVVSFNNISNGGSDCEYADANGNPMTDTPTQNFYSNATISYNALGPIGILTGPESVSPGQSAVVYTVPEITNATSYNWTLPVGASGTSTTNSILVNFSDNAISGNLSVKGQNACGESLPSVLFVTVNKTVQLNLFLEGLYNHVNQMMNKSKDENGDRFAEDIADQIDLQIRSSIPPYQIIYSFSALNLRTDGSCQFIAPPELTNSYYLVIKHRNHIETWSGIPVSFLSGSIQYDFTDQPSKAYGSNLKSIGSIYTLISGDINQDSFVDGMDMILLDNMAAVFSAGYIPEDLNGDGSINGLDMLLLGSNSSAFVGVKMP